MSELERELRNVGAEIEYPPTPDLAGAVRERIEARRRSRFSLSRRKLALALAILAAGVGAAMATPQARTAILEWLGLRGVAIERIETAPTVTRTAAELDELDLGERVTLADARRRAAYAVVVPPARLGEPDAIYFDERIPGGQVAFVYRAANDVPLIVSEFRARLDEILIHKLAGPGTEIDAVRVEGEPGWWLEGEPHEFGYVDPESGEVRVETLRLAGNTLLWQHGEFTLRLEGAVSRNEALAIAEGVE